MEKYFFTLIILSFIAINNAWEITFEHQNYTVFMDEEERVNFTIKGDSEFSDKISLEILSEDNNIIVLNEKNDGKLNLLVEIIDGVGTDSFHMKGNFLGITRLILTLTETDNGKSIELPPLDVKVIRKQRAIDRAFTGSVATLVALIYINFGCALDWGALRGILKRPIGPLIGFFGQFGVMPALGYVIGLIVFPDSPAMRLGLLFTGVSPAGGASNVWTVVLDGNMDLSVTMTTISTLAAFGMMPLWLFTLGPHIFEEAKLGVPYEHVASLAFALIVPLGIGWLIQRFLPRVSQILVRILKGFSALLILFIVIFAIATNLYLFKLASWQIAVSGLLLPWCGYALGGLVAILLRQPKRDVIAIAIETGVQNTGIAIFLLRFSLPQPQADLTTVIPVAIAVMTPIPLTLLYIFKRCFRTKKKEQLNFTESSEMVS